MVATIGPPFCFVGFGTDRLRRQEAMKTAAQLYAQRSEPMERKPRTTLLNGVGWTSRKNPAIGEVFSS
jgi:hypothetical protein